MPKVAYLVLPIMIEHYMLSHSSYLYGSRTAATTLMCLLESPGDFIHALNPRSHTRPLKPWCLVVDAGINNFQSSQSDSPFQPSLETKCTTQSPLSLTEFTAYQL